jgi:uncharacterized phosphatase
MIKLKVNCNQPGSIISIQNGVTLMLVRKEFYFVRHGQTDYNLSKCKVDHEDVSLNATGLRQAQEIESIVATLSIKSVCYSPFKRAKETKEIITSRLQIDHYEMPDLGECTRQVWNDMTTSGMGAYQSHYPHVRSFMEKAINGINQALSYQGPTLIVSHGGIHWVICSLMNISTHDWVIDNCLPVHFFIENKDQWKARKII